MRYTYARDVRGVLRVFALDRPPPAAQFNRARVKVMLRYTRAMRRQHSCIVPKDSTDILLRENKIAIN